MTTTTADSECGHNSGCGYRNPPFYPEQEQLKPGEFWCYDCKSVVPDPIEVARLHAAAQPCLRSGQGNCRGEVSARQSYGGTGTTIYECAHHMDESAEREQALRQRYPEHQPADFDPGYAGESWYEDDY
ncbi:hypothetical protein [Nocardia amamiensis]|uniref:hypothetical protein n=1 Tax=Nocardia amamiensis TaxID=404578 RepID=UPI000A5D6BCB|nr:hypothetical protein [Nocardia amamiensis]